LKEPTNEEQSEGSKDKQNTAVLEIEVTHIDTKRLWTATVGMDVCFKLGVTSLAGLHKLIDCALANKHKASASIDVNGANLELTVTSESQFDGSLKHSISLVVVEQDRLAILEKIVADLTARNKQLEAVLTGMQVYSVQGVPWSAHEHPRQSIVQGWLPMASQTVSLSAKSRLIVTVNAHALSSSATTRVDVAIRIDGKECGPSGFTSPDLSRNAGRSFCSTPTWNHCSALAVCELDSGKHLVEACAVFPSGAEHGNVAGVGLVIQVLPIVH
jgi:hypothetical protein